MTAIDDYRKTLTDLVEEYSVREVLEIGVENGVSTKVFCECGCKVIGVDVRDYGYRHGNLTFVKTDASSFLDNVDITMEDRFDLIYLDAFYTIERLEHDVPILWKLLRKGGALVFNEYVDFAGHRGGQVREFVHKWAYENMRRFVVCPLRNGQAVFKK